MTVKISLSATEFPIKSVKVFSCGEAEVTRTFPLDLANCPVRLNESLIIEISRLPILIGAIGPPSLTTGSEDLLITDYYCSDCRPNSFSAGPPDVSSDVLRDLIAKCTSLEEERQLRQRSFAFLSTYMDSLAQGKAPGVTDPAQLVTFFDEFVELGKSRSEIIAILDQQISDLQKEIREEIVRLRHQCFTLATTTTVVLAPVHDHTVNTAELELVYRVKATWKPVYEVHVTTIDSAPSSSVVLNYRCQISQSTGEDWDDVELVVTTANPDALLVGLPEPKKMKLVQMFPRSYHHTPASWNIPGEGSAFTSILSQPPPTASTGLFGNTQGTAPSLGLFGAAARPNVGNTFAQNTSIQGSGPTNQGLFGTSLFGSGSAQSQASSATSADLPPPYPPPLNSNFSTSGESTATSSSNQPASNVQQPPTVASSVPAPPSPLRSGQGIVLAESENDVTHTATTKVFIPSRKEAHYILIATIPLKASFTRVAAPAVDPRVFYTCEITNTSKNVLISGPVHTYLDGNHVSDSKLVNNAQTQTIQCCLGVDPAVTTELDKRIVSSDNIAPLFPSYGRKTHTITITVKNTHKEPIGNLVVRASLPVSQNPRITVSLREPIGLATIGSGSVVVRDRCSARWSTTEDRTAENGGVIEWVCRDVQPGSVMLKAAWDVTAPRDFNVVET